MNKRTRNIILIFLAAVLAVLCVIVLLKVWKTDEPQLGGEEMRSAADESLPEDGNLLPEDQSTAGESDGDRAARYAAYREALESVLYDHVFPDDSDVNDMGTEDGYGNYFAVSDIDGDGREELLIQWTTASMAGMKEAVYDYDIESSTFKTELNEFPGITYYDNGVVEAGWSHNQGLNRFSADEFWPYNAYRYDGDADAYVLIAMVDAWDKAVSDKNFSGDAFPEELDADGDGILYSVMEDSQEGDRYYAQDTLMDGPEFAQWQESYRSDGTQITVPWQALTLENIQAVLADDQPFYGRWYVWDYQMAGISALSQEDAQEYVGTEIVYETNYVRLNEAKLPAPGFTYTFADYTEEAFRKDYQADLGEWWNGISEITYGEINTTDNDFGSHFFAVSDEVIWIYHEGVFFLARREKPDTAVG